MVSDNARSLEQWPRRFSGADCAPFLINTSFSMPGAEPLAEISPIRPKAGRATVSDHRVANMRRKLWYWAS
jgi:hypothetical protein